MGLFKKRKRSPQELEEKSRREREWADRCYQAGERFGRKYNLKGKVQWLNDLANHYPKSFFGTLLAIVVGSFVLNMLVMRCQISTGDLHRDLQGATLERDTSRQVMNRQIQALYLEMDRLNNRLEQYMEQDTLSRTDSLEIGHILIRMDKLDQLITGKEQLVQPAEGLEEDSIYVEED